MLATTIFTASFLAAIFIGGEQQTFDI